MTPNIKNFIRLKNVPEISELYKLDELLGKGSFGSVYRSQSITTNKLCAVKVIHKAKIQ